MSRWHDRSLDGIARWANLSPEERIADRVADILDAAEDIGDIVGGLEAKDLQLVSRIRSAVDHIYDTASSMMVALPQPGPPPQRDLSVQAILDDIEAWLRAKSERPDYETKDIRFALQAFAAPYAPVLYFELRRLEYLVGFGRSSGSSHRSSL